MEAIGTGAAANLASEAAKGIFQEAKRHVKYVIDCNKNVEEFEEKKEFLLKKRKSVQQEIDVEEMNLWKIKADVNHWCDEVDKAIVGKLKKEEDVEEKAKAKCFFGVCPANIKTRYQLSRKAVDNVKAINDLLQQCRQFNSVAVSSVPKARIIVPNYFEDFSSRKEISEDIMEALKNPSISMIGVYGAAGMGKTTLVKEVARKFQEEKVFDPVIIATVGKDPNIEGIQNQIAELLGLTLQEQSKENRARRLCGRLKNEKKVLIVLDNIWGGWDLKEIGIPFGDQKKQGSDTEKFEDQNNICKIVLTSRDRNVLTSTTSDVKTFAVDVLEDKEALKLFNKIAENVFEKPEVETVALEVAKKCGRLPLAIVTVASALRNRSLEAWKAALQKLETPAPRNFTGETKEVYSAIKLSYDNLDGEELRKTFMLCCLLGNKANIQDLWRCAMGLQLFDRLRTVEQIRTEVLNKVSMLKDSCLLLDGYSNDYFIVHDLVRDVTLAIAYGDNHAFALKHEDEFEERRMKKFEWVSSSSDSIKKLPLKLECPRLTLLFLGTTSSGDSYVEMPTKFFGKMTKLKVLNLTRMDFFSSTSSISLPTSLRTLCLKCCKVGDLVNLGKLVNLEILSLSGSTVEILPKEIGQLTKLRILDLSYCTKLSIIPPGVLSSLSKLEELYMSFVSSVLWNRQDNARLDELKELSGLTTLHIHIHIPDAKMVPKDLFSVNLKRYNILIGGEWPWADDVEYSKTIRLKVKTSIDHLDDGLKCLLKKTEALYVKNLEGVGIVLKQVGNRDCFLNLKHLHIRDASEIQYIIKDNEATDKIAFRGLRSLALVNLPRLISFCSSKNTTDQGSTSQPQHDELPLFGEQMELPCLEDLCLFSINVGRIWHNKFSADLENLTRLGIQDCGYLKYIFSASLATRLVHLKSFEIVDCRSLTDIILTEDNMEKEKAISFPQLSILKMKNLPHLIGYCSENYKIAFPLLWELEIEQCPKFNGLVYKSVDSKRVVFNKKVECPNLVNLKLCAIKVERIWDDQLPDMSLYVKKLGWLWVEGCHNLKCLFSSSMMPLLSEFRIFVTKDCANVEAIFIEEEKDDITLPKLSALWMVDLPKLMTFCFWHGSSLKFPSLRTLLILICPTLRTFISDSKNAKGNGSSSNIDFPTPLFNEKVAFPQLEKLFIVYLENCRKIWHDQLDCYSFSKLDVLWVSRCDRLVNIFPVNMSKRLHNLRDFHLGECASLDEIFESQVLNANEVDAVTAPQSSVEETFTNFEFPKLTYLKFHFLPSLKSFFSKKHTTEWPSLKIMWVFRCNMVEIFAAESQSFEELTNQRTLFWVNEVSFPNLEELKLESNYNLTKIWHGRLESDVFSKLRVFKLIGFSDTSSVFPHCFIQLLPNLEILFVRDPPLSHIFNLEGNKIDALALTSLARRHGYIISEAFRKLRIVAVQNCGKLKNLVPSWISFENLTWLKVSGCHGLVNLISFSTAKSLVQLKAVIITNCGMIEEIIGGDEAKEDRIVFAQLKYLTLSCLPSLSSFCLKDHVFEFPALEMVIVEGCPNMKSFCQGDVRTPELHKVTLIDIGEYGYDVGEDEEEYKSHKMIDIEDEIDKMILKVTEDVDEENVRWEGNLNATIKWLFDKRAGYLQFENLELIGSSEWVELWGRNIPQRVIDFRSLKSLQVCGCRTLRFLFTSSMALDIAQLGEIKVIHCARMGHIIVDEGADHEQEEEVKNKIVFPRLSSIILESCGNFASFYRGSQTLECPSLEQLKVNNCPKMFAFSSKFARHQRITETVDDGSGNIYAAAFFNDRVALENLRALEVSKCHGFVNLIACSTAKSLVQLTRMSISDCNMTRKIIGGDGDDEEVKGDIVLTRLNYLRLSCLPSLSSFCSTDHVFEFPALAKMIVRDCPKMKIFCQGDARTLLPRVILREDA